MDWKEFDDRPLIEFIFFFFFDLLMTSYLESDMSTRFEHRLQ